MEYRSSSHGVKARPIATGSVDWKTIAPVMFPSASESLPSRTQKKLFAFSIMYLFVIFSALMADHLIVNIWLNAGSIA